MLALFALPAAPAVAEIRVIDPVGGAATTVVARGEAELLGWSDDGAALWVRDGRRVLRVSAVDGTATRAPGLDDAESIGPGGRWAGDGEIHAPDGRVIASYDVSPLDAGEPPRLAWSRDGARVAVLSAPNPLSVSQRLLVVDTATGAVLARRDGIEDLSPQAFAPDASALVVVTRNAVLRIAVPGGTLLERRRLTSSYGQIAVWSVSGAVAIAQLRGIDVVGGPRIPVDDAEIIAWSGDGTLLAYRFSTPRTRCSYPQSGLDVVVPGQPARAVFAPDDGELHGFAWAPRGHLLAVESEPAPPPEPRGKRHPWPKRVATDYAMPTRGGDRALRRIVLRATRSLRRDARREAVLSRLRDDYAAVEERLAAARENPVRKAVAKELDRWLHAAGYPRLRRLSEFSC